MAQGNRAQNKPKGFRLPADTCEMLEQITKVKGGSEAHYVNDAVVDYFMHLKQQYRQSFGDSYWDSVLESRNHIDRLKNRRKLPVREQ